MAYVIQRKIKQERILALNWQSSEWELTLNMSDHRRPNLGDISTKI